jgi:4-amino-4-deoxy-L-arabinose transferase-like glycosyltransferase
LFLALYGLSIFLLTQTENPAYQKWLYVLFASTVSLAILTKGIAALMFAPGLLLYLFLEKKFLRVVFCREFLGSVLFIVSIGAGYYLLREIYNPGYLQAVFDNELGGRFLKVNDGHNGPFWKYFYEILNDEFTYWMPFLFMGIVAIFSEKLLPFKKVRKLGVFSLVVSLSHLLVLSTSATKLFWYAAPEFPFYAIIAALGLFSIIFHLTKFLPSKYSSGIVTIFLVLLFYKPYTETLSYVLNERDERWNEDFYSVGNFLVDNKAKNLDGYKIIYNGDLVRPYLCHIYELKTKGQTLKMCKAKDLKIGDVALIQTDSDRVNIKQHFNFNEINKNGNFSAWKMIEQKP